MFVDMKETVRLLIVNPNTSVTVTDRFCAEARAVAPEGVVIHGVTGAFGAAIVSTEAENVVAGHAALQLLARYGGAHDAAILAISFDSALDAAREVMSIPVVGLTEASIDEALTGRSKIGLVVFGAVSRPLYERLLLRYGRTAPVVGIEIVDVASSQNYLDHTDRDQRVLAAAERLVAREGAQAVVVCGAAVVGIARRLRDRLSVPLIDGAAPAVRSVLRCLQTALAWTPPRPLGGTSGLDPALAALIAGHGPETASGGPLPPQSLRLPFPKG
jgi:allantoin racemase